MASLTSHLRVVVHQLAIARNPLVIVDVSNRQPAVEILAIEKSPWLRPLLRHRPVKDRRLHARDHRTVGGIAAFFYARQLVCVRGRKLPAHRRTRACFLHHHDQFARLHPGVRNRMPRAAPWLHAAFDLTPVIGELHPLRIRFAIGRGDGHIPTAKKLSSALRRNSRGERSRQNRDRQDRDKQGLIHHTFECNVPWLRCVESSRKAAFRKLRVSIHAHLFRNDAKRDPGFAA